MTLSGLILRQCRFVAGSETVMLMALRRYVGRTGSGAESEAAGQRQGIRVAALIANHPRPPGCIKIGGGG